MTPPGSSSHENPTINPMTSGFADAATPTMAPSTGASSQAELIAAEGGRIGPYSLVGVIGEGGFGVVFAADQTEPIRRRIALKVVKPGMDSRAVLSRFEQERQALAIIDHPNVARVLDAGTTVRGRPYFAMEFVAGEPITAYCDRHKLSTRQRLELFIPVCEAVHHAHTKGIIHRDLKPSNILVALIGDRPIAKVIDFGVAKALHDRSGSAIAHTEVGQIIGTPEYMSPEQAEMSVLDIDTRTDVYALGVVLYELLTGVLPLDSRTIRNLSLVEMQRVIRDVDPPRPSTRLSTLGKDAHAIAERRRSELHALAKELSRELEWIPLKAMRKDRTERYRSAVELADDIRNYLDGRPLIAGPESAVYRLRKYIRRHRLQVGAAAAVLLALVGGLIATTLALAEARAANQRAEELRSRLLEVQSQLLAAQVPEAVGMAAGLDPDRRGASPAPPGSKNEGATEPADEPSKVTAETDLRSNVDDRLADAEATQRHIVELSVASLGDDHPDTLSSRVNLARLLIKRGRIDEAEAALRKVYESRSRGRDPESPAFIAVSADLGSVLVQRGKAAEAEPILRRAADAAARLHGPDDNRTLVIMGDLARALRAQKKYTDAAELFGRIAEARAKPSGPENPGALVAAQTHGVALREAGRLDKAEAILTGVLDSMKRAFGEEHPVTFGCWRDLGRTLAAAGKYDRAEVIMAEMHRRAAQRFGPRSRLASDIAGDLAAICEAAGKAEDAAKWREQARPRAGAGK